MGVPHRLCVKPNIQPCIGNLRLPGRAIADFRLDEIRAPAMGRRRYSGSIENVGIRVRTFGVDGSRGNRFPQPERESRITAQPCDNPLVLEIWPASEYKEIALLDNQPHSLTQILRT